MNKQELTQQSATYRRGWVIWGLAACAFFTDYIVRVSPTCMVSELMSTFGQSSLQISSLTAYFIYAYVGMQLPVGVLLDRYGAHFCLTVSVTICALSNYTFASTESLHMAQLARFSLGFGAAFAFVSALKLASAWFPPERFSILVGITQALGMVGGAAGAGLMGRLVQTHGWQESSLFFAYILAGLAVAIAFIVRNEPKKSGAAKTSSTPKTDNQTGILEGLRIVLKNPQTWIVSTFAGLIFLPTMVLPELWGSFFLHHAHGLSINQANDAISVVFIGWAIGGPFAGAISNHIGRRNTMIISSFLSLVIIPIVLFWPGLSVTAIYILLFSYGLANTGLVAAYTTVAEINPKSTTGVSLGFANGMSVVIGAVCQQLVGAAIDHQRLARGATEMGDYLPSELQWAMSIVVVGSALAFILSFFTKETFDPKLHLQEEEKLALGKLATADP